ncbi:PhzF family phenazine biosynthesis protein [Sphingomonas abietis]|uniref:PhzF family phenazine biosynthesis protein n=1 Tax=Sphingomonas abietis TaxID=3012344 RepID=A0ABY7NNG9_9SPHN|nr:PhzF family phenazine biosynthesis protein [Sphingomonas abietis]WBO23063.1 PhzF family phenazine biosynthesis protein [Sphingomonas abietis]
MRLPIIQVDAFADAAFTGNPAAVMPLDAWLDDDLLQKIAAENNLSETAFLLPDASGVADYELRWFTPTVEVVMCGHATLASGHAILAAEPTRERVTFRTRRAGILEVGRDGDAYTLSLPALAPSPKPLPELVAALGVAPVETLYREGGYCVVVLENEAAVRAVDPDMRAIAAGGDRQAIVTAPGDATDVVSRMFAPGGGIDEDPVTGSAHAVITPYWAEKLGRDRFTAFQASARGGHVGCTLAGDRVILSGRCVTVIEGTFLL